MGIDVVTDEGVHNIDIAVRAGLRQHHVEGVDLDDGRRGVPAVVVAVLVSFTCASEIRA
jgi:hypothetical protein